MNEFQHEPSGPRVSAGTIEDIAATTIINEPMPESARTTVPIWRHQLHDWADECGRIKKRASSAPYLFTIGWAVLTAGLYSAVGLYVSHNSQPKSGHNIFLMYEWGMGLGIVVGLIVLGFAWSKRSNFRTDLDDLAKRIERPHDVHGGEN
jgi:hypothetical protein